MSRKIVRIVVITLKASPRVKSSLTALTVPTVPRTAVTSKRNCGMMLCGQYRSQLAFESVGKSLEKTLAK